MCCRDKTSIIFHDLLLAKKDGENPICDIWGITVITANKMKRDCVKLLSFLHLYTTCTRNPSKQTKNPKDKENWWANINKMVC